MSPMRHLIVALFLACPALRAQTVVPVSAPGPALAAPSAAAEAPALDRAGLLARLAADLGAHYALADVLDLDLLRPWSPPPGATLEGVAVAEYPELLAPSLLLRVRYLAGERILREDTLSLRACMWRESLVAAAPLARGDVVSQGAVETRRIDALRDREALPVSVIGEGYVFSRAVPAGRPLTWRDVARRPLVHRGQTVEVQATDGALLITMKALAMQDGARGEAVRVRNLESRREFTALVVDENRAEVRF